MTTFKERLEQAAREKGVDVSQARADLAKLIGSTRSNMTHWWTGRAKEPKGGAVAVAATYFGVNPLWLARGEGAKNPGGKVPAPTTGRRRFMTLPQGVTEGEIEAVLTMYFEMDHEVRGTWRRQGRDLLELMGLPSTRNPFGKGKRKRARRSGNA